MASVWHLFFSLVFLFVLPLKIGSAFQCWECNTWYDWRCGDPFTETTFAKTNCSHRFPKATNFVCRKLVQKVKGKERTVRSCGYLMEPRKSCFTHLGTYDVSTLYCECAHDSCNSANCLISAVSTSLNLVLALILRVLFVAS